MCFTLFTKNFAFFYTKIFYFLILQEDDSNSGDEMRKRRREEETGVHQCNQCDKFFNKQSSLARHKYEHSGNFFCFFVTYLPNYCSMQNQV